MRTLGYGIACLCLLTFSGLIPARYITLPSPRAASTAANPLDELLLRNFEATDIVVTDADGRVLENWRGELKPGDVVRLGTANQSPANVLPLGWVRLRPDRALSGFYQPPQQPVVWRGYYGGAEPYTVPEALHPSDVMSALRLVLFLRKGGGSGPGTIWMPAAQPVHRAFDESFRGSRYLGDGRDRPAPPVFLCNEPNDFTTSAALIEAGRLVAPKNGLFVPLRLGANDFRREVLACPAPIESVRWVEPPAPQPQGSSATLLLGSQR